MLSRFALTTAASRASRRWPAVATSSLSTRSQAQTSPESDKQQGTKKSSPAARESSSFVQNIFRGIVQPEQIFPYPDVMTEDQRETLAMLLGPAERFFTEEHDSLAADAAGKVPDKTMKALADLGAFGLQVPVELGGAGLTNSQYGRVTEILGATDLGLAITLGAHQSIGFKGILILGNEQQKEKYLPALAAGEKIAAFALTEPSSGSDAGSIKSRAVPTEDGKKYILNGSKIWISNGGIADVYTVFAKTPVKDEKTGVETDKVTAFIVERDFGGVSSGPPNAKMGIKCCDTAEVFFENVPIPAENIIDGLGNGFKVAMQILNNGRFGMGTAMSGTMRGAIEKAVDFARSRSQFGDKIENYGAIQEKIARCSMLQYATESMAYMVSGTMDRGYQDYQLEAAISKVFGSECAWYVTDEAIQVMGGMGYMRENGLEKVMRDLRIFRIFEGTNDILRLFVALTGIQYAGGHLKELQRAVKDPISNFGVVLGEVTKRGRSAMGFGAGNVLADHVHSNLKSQAGDLCTSVEQFGTSIEKLLIKHGKNIIHEQFVLKRIADSAIDIYATACLLSRCSRSLDEGAASARHEELMTKTYSNEAFDRIQANLAATRDQRQLENFKNMAEISRKVCEAGQAVQQHPLRI